jgi:hypothetical protein
MKKFFKGDRVIYSKEAKVRFRIKHPDRCGTIISDSNNKSTYVVWDNTKTKLCIHDDFLELEK